MKINHLIGLLLVLLVCCQTHGQAGGKIKFTHLEEYDGLSENHISCIIQDQKGFLWVGTYNGLNCYDGHEVQTFKNVEDKASGLPSNKIQSLYADSTGAIWIGTRDAGLCRYDPRTRTFTFPKIFNAAGEQDSVKSIFRITQGYQHQLYAVSSDKGLIKIDLEKLTGIVLPVVLPETGREHFNIHDLIVDQDCLWLGTYGAGVLCYVPGKGVIKQYTGENAESPYHFKEVIRLVRSRYPYVWISAYSSLLHRLNTVTGESVICNQPVADNLPSTIYDILEEGPDSVWLATISDGLQLLHPGDLRISLISGANDEGGLQTKSTTSVFRSREGILWVGTRDKGIAYSHPATNMFEVFSKATNGPTRLDVTEIKSLFADYRFLFAGGYDGLNRIDPKTLKKDYYLPEEIVTAICPYPDDSLLLVIGTDEGKILSFNKATGTNHALINLRPLLPDTENAPKILCIKPFRGNRILLGTDQGLVIVDLQNRSIEAEYHSSNDQYGIPSGGILNILPGKGGSYWLGSNQDGLALFNPDSGSFVRYGNKLQGKHYLPSSTILSSIKDSKNRMWLGTTNGLLLFDPEQGVVKVISESEGLPSNYVVSICEGHNGCLWLTSLVGLSMFNPVNEEVRVFSTYNGLPSNRFSIGAAFEGPDHKIFLGTSSGFIAFHSKDVRNILPPPDPKFINLLVFNEEPDLEANLPYLDKIIIKPHQEFLTIEISAFDFLFDQDIHCRYRIAEISDQWYELGKNRIISFSELKPLEYTLEVEVANEQSGWVASKKPLTMIVRPSLFQRTSVRLSLVFILGLLVAGIFRFRNRYLKLQRQRLLELVEIRTAELSSSEQNLLAANQAKDKFFSILAHDLRSPFNSLLGLSKILEEDWAEQSEESKKGYVGIIRRNLENTYGLLNNLLSWSRIQQKRYTADNQEVSLFAVTNQTVMELDAPAHVKDIKIHNQVDPEIKVFADEMMLGTVIRNLLSNAIKYSPRGHQVTIKSRVDHQSVVCCVQDEGAGMSQEIIETLFSLTKTKSEPGTEGEKGTGLGLIITRDFLSLMNGQFFFESQPGQGSTFCFSLPQAPPNGNP